jgi:purine-cytosine permease-like protein
MLERRWFRWMLILAFWTLLAVFFASQNAMTAAYRQRPITWRQTLVFPAINYGLWALLTPLVRETMQTIERRLDRQCFCALTAPSS